MKKKEIKEAYEALEFSENLQDKYFEHIISRKKGRASGRMKKWAPAFLCLLLVGTTVYAAEKFDFLGWYYGESARLVQDQGADSYAVQNEHIRMSVEHAVFAEEYGIVFLHIQSLDEQGKEFMERKGENLNLTLTMENGQGKNVGSGSCTKLCKEICDEENWYYTLQTAYHEDGSAEEHRMAKISFPSENKVEKQYLANRMLFMEFEFPIKEALGDVRAYEDCGEFEEVTLSPLAVSVSWECEKEPLRRVKKLEIHKKDGSVQILEHKYGVGYQMGEEWEMIFSSEKDGKKKVTAIPKQLFELEEIGSVVLNGQSCH